MYRVQGTVTHQVQGTVMHQVQGTVMYWVQGTAMYWVQGTAQYRLQLSGYDVTSQSNTAINSINNIKAKFYEMGHVIKLATAITQCVCKVQFTAMKSQIFHCQKIKHIWE